MSENTRPASLDDLLAKKPAREVVAVPVGDEKVTITFQAIGRKAYEQLLAKHTPEPTPEQRKKGETPSEDIDAFGPELLSACAVEPELPLDFAQRIWNEWGNAEVASLYTAALRVNTKTGIERLGEG